MTDFLTYMAEIEPTFLEKIRGADLPTVETLEGEIGSALPADYREYLLALGEDDGGLGMFEDCVTNASSLLTFYRVVRADPYPECELPSSFAVVGFSGTIIPDVFLGLDGEVTGQLWAGESRTPGACFAGSFRMAVYRAGVTWRYARSRFKTEGTCWLVSQHRPGTLAEITQYLQDQGFELLPFSDPYGACGERGDGMAFTARLFAGGQCNLRLLGAKMRVLPFARAIVDAFRYRAEMWQPHSDVE